MTTSASATMPGTCTPVGSDRCQGVAALPCAPCSARRCFTRRADFLRGILR